MNNWRKFGRINFVTALLVALCVSVATRPQVASAAGLPIQAVVPARLADTRAGEKTVDGRYEAMGVRSARSSTEIKIAGRGGVPADAKAVMLNLTVVQWLNPTTPLSDNFLTVYPCTATPPQASNLNTPVADVRANNVFVKLSSSGNVCVYSEKMSHFVIDVNGFVPAGGATESVNPARLFDSRPGERTIDGKFAGGGRLLAGSRTRIQIAGRGGVPLNATSAIINVTDVLPSDGNLLKVYPCTSDLPEASSLNTPAYDIRANNVYVRLDDGAVCVYTVRATNVVVDVGGFVPPDGTLETLASPTRLFDSRPGEKTVDGKYQGGGRVGPNSTTEIRIAGRGEVGGDATVAVINLTSIFPSTGNYLTAYPCDAPRPNASNVNSPTGDIRANGAVVKLSAAGTVCVYSVYETDFVVDASGYSDTPPIPLRILGNACGSFGEVLTSVDYYNGSLDAAAPIAETTYIRVDSGYGYNWPETYQGYKASGGTPPYTFEASGLVGYTLNKQTGGLTYAGGSPKPIAFTLTVTDAAGSKLTVPAKVTWEPRAALYSDYQAFLPNGHTFAGPKLVNWGTQPLAYSWVGPSGVKINPSTGELTYRANNTDELMGTINVTDSTGAVRSINTYIQATRTWPIRIANGRQIGLGEPLAQFNPDGWGVGPYSFAVVGGEAVAFGVNSFGQVSVTNSAYLVGMNLTLANPSAYYAWDFSLTVTDATGKQIVVPVSVQLGRLPTIPFVC